MPTLKWSTASKYHDGKCERASAACCKGKSMTILNVGMDRAKNVFAVHAVDEHGKPAPVRPSVPRAKLHELIVSLRRARWQWRPAQVTTTRRGCLPRAATPCGWSRRSLPLPIA